MKNKEWLKNSLADIFDRNDRIETSKLNCYVADEVDDLVDQLEEPAQEKVVVPQFVADWIEKCKKERFTLYGALRYGMGEVEGWIFANGFEGHRTELIARAWLDGYTVEKEKLYRVELPVTVWDGDASELKQHTELLALDITSDETRISHIFNKYGDYRTELTETEIKAIDERYWAFAEEVTE